MNALTTIATGSSEKTMSSLEIAELTGKRHADVMRDIRTMLRDLGQGLSNFAQAYRHPQNGQEFPCFNLPRDLTFTLVTGYSIPLRKKVIDRWMEFYGELSQGFCVGLMTSISLNRHLLPISSIISDKYI